MKKLILFALSLLLVVSFSPSAQAGDCSTRSEVDWHATIKSATNVRVDCDDHKGPVGTSIGVVSAGEKVRIVEVDRNREYFIIETSKGRGFVYVSFLKDIVESPLPEVVEEVKEEHEEEKHEEKVEVKHEEKVEKKHADSVFHDLDPAHKYYQHIADVKAKGIVSGTSDGKIKADDSINRVELAKILVEATMDDDSISKAELADGVYSDVEKKGWYRPYLHLAKQKGIMTGDKKSGSGATTVRPGDSANGAEVAKMIAIAFDLEVREAKSYEQWFVPYMEVLEQKGALPYANGLHQVTRGEMMFIISVILSD